MKSLAVIIAVASIHVNLAFFWLSRHHSQPPNHINQLQMSFGDPDLSSKSEFYRRFQNFARLYDRVIFTDRDIPGLTFASPVEWAPWMETIWFGNYYDYRSSYFHDVMYSNNLPGKEGALLHRDSRASLKLALLYQRYKKFDESSYSVSNATFFNLFAANNLRLGRYKVILPSSAASDQLILCTSDPLTYSDLRRYVNSFAMLKWFKAKFMQQKRKRQTVLTLSSPDFFAQCVHFIEFRAAIDALDGSSQRDSSSSSRRRTVMTVPILPLPSYLARYNRDDSSDSKYDGLVLSRLIHEHPQLLSCSWPTAVANSQYFLDNLWTQVMRSLSSSLSSANNGKAKNKAMKVMVGGDGRLLNDFGLDRLLNINQAIDSDSNSDSNSKRIELVLSARGKLTVDQAISAMQSGDVQAAIILSVGEELELEELSAPLPSLPSTDPHQAIESQKEREEEQASSFSSEGGLGGRWGYTVLDRKNSDDGREAAEVQSWSSDQYLYVAEAMTMAGSVKIMLHRHADSILDQLYSSSSMD